MYLKEKEDLSSGTKMMTFNSISILLSIAAFISMIV